MAPDDSGQAEAVQEKQSEEEARAGEMEPHCCDGPEEGEARGAPRKEKLASPDEQPARAARPEELAVHESWRAGAAGAASAADDAEHKASAAFSELRAAWRMLGPDVYAMPEHVQEVITLDEILRQAVADGDRDEARTKLKGGVDVHLQRQARITKVLTSTMAVSLLDGRNTLARALGGRRLHDKVLAMCEARAFSLALVVGVAALHVCLWLALWCEPPALAQLMALACAAPPILTGLLMLSRKTLVMAIRSFVWVYLIVNVCIVMCAVLIIPAGVAFLWVASCILLLALALVLDSFPMRSHVRPAAVLAAVLSVLLVTTVRSRPLEPGDKFTLLGVSWSISDRVSSALINASCAFVLVAYNVLSSPTTRICGVQVFATFKRLALRADAKFRALQSANERTEAGAALSELVDKKKKTQGSSRQRRSSSPKMRRSSFLAMTLKPASRAEVFPEMSTLWLRELMSRSCRTLLEQLDNPLEAAAAANQQLQCFRGDIHGDESQQQLQRHASRSSMLQSGRLSAQPLSPASPQHVSASPDEKALFVLPTFRVVLVDSFDSVANAIGGKALSTLVYRTLKSTAWQVLCLVTSAIGIATGGFALAGVAPLTVFATAVTCCMCVMLFNSLLLSRRVLLRLLSQPTVIFATGNQVLMAGTAAFVYEDPAASLVLIGCMLAHSPSTFADAGPGLRSKNAQWGVYFVFALAFLIFAFFATFSNTFPAMQTRLYVREQQGRDSPSYLVLATELFKITLININVFTARLVYRAFVLPSNSLLVISNTVSVRMRMHTATKYVDAINGALVSSGEDAAASAVAAYLRKRTGVGDGGTSLVRTLKIAATTQVTTDAVDVA